MGDFWYGRRVLIAGGNGFIGSALLSELVRRRARVTATVRRDTTRLADFQAAGRISVVRADLTQMEECEAATRGQDHVLIAAALDGNAEFKRQRAAYIFRTNSLITMNLLEACRLNGVGAVTYLSSADVYEGIDAVSLSETIPLGDVSGASFNSYALAKLFGETASRMFYHEHGLPVAIARPCNVYGPGDVSDRQRGRVIPQWIAAGLEGLPIRVWGTGAEVRSFIFIDDLVEGVLRLSELYSCAVPVNLAGPEECSLIRLAECIRRIGRFDSPIQPVETPASTAVRRVLDITRAREVLDFRPMVGMDSGLAKTIAYSTRSSVAEVSRAN